MKLILQKRAEVALRSLPPIEQKQVYKALIFIEEVSFPNLMSEGKVKKLTGAVAGFYSYRASYRLRILFSIHTSRLVIEYILYRDHLEKMLRGMGEP